MKHLLIRLLGICTVCLGFFARGSTLYVDLNSGNPTPPYSDWSTAATNIQDAIDASTDGDQIWVTNGIYQTGGKVVTGNLTNRVELDKAVTVQSVNGPFVTTIAGIGATNNAIAVRCAWLTNNAALIGFTLMRGATRTSGDSITLESGGGVWCASSNSVVASCIIVSNTALLRAGAAYQGTLNACYISSNSVPGSLSGGAAYGAVLNNCTVVSNNCAGVASCFATNSIIYYDPFGEYTASSLSYCCTTPLPAGTGNFTNAPQFFSDRIHLLNGSACEGAGTTPVASVDIVGKAWGTPPAVGCAESAGLPLVGAPQVQFGNAPLGFTVGNALLSGIGSFTFSWLKDGAPLQDDGHFSFTQTANLSVTGATFADVGNYRLVVGNAFGTVTSAVAQVAIRCVDAAGTNPVAPYTSWETAATNIQDAIDASADGHLIWVTNGIYQTGGKVMAGDLTNRVVLDKAVTVLSVNGPFVTTIAGIGATNGTLAVRCAWLTNNAALDGFTLTRGATRSTGTTALETGGAVWCASSNAAVRNCVIVSNTAFLQGGGAFQGALSACFISGNSVTTPSGGAAAAALVNNCTVVSNATVGLANCKATNSICHFNPGNNYAGGSFSYCSVIPAAPGVGNFTAIPVFFADGIHLALGSPGVGAGTSPVIPSDIFGHAWGAPPTVGCAETAAAPYVSPPQIQLTGSPPGFKINASTIGVQPLSYAWLKNGALLQDDGHFAGTQSTNLIVTGMNFADAAEYQFVVTNSLGAVTSSIARVIIHCVDSAGNNPAAPFTSWETAATNIQDAIDAASAGEIVLVTNGVYSGGGKVMSGDLTNRVVLDKALTVTSVNGYKSTVIEGQWDIASTNGPGAIRCAWLTNGAVLNGFTLRKGATRGGSSFTVELHYGGGAWLYANALISNCVLTNNSAVYAGGGVAFGIVKSCYLTRNIAQKGGGAYQSSLNNCTISWNHLYYSFNNSGGVESCVSRNCIIFDNFFGDNDAQQLNYPSSSFSDRFTNCSTSPLPASFQGVNNITSNPLFLSYSGNFALSPASPCRGTGNSLFVAGNDLDGEPFLDPPAIGCDEIIDTNLTGPLSFTFLYFGTNTTASHRIFYAASFDGRASELDWSFGEGPTVTNLGGYASHTWMSPGIYTVTLTAYNADHPAGVSSNLVVTVDPFLSPTIQSAGIVSNAFQFSFNAQEYGLYTVQYATNLTPPVAWQNLQLFLFSTSNTVMTIQDPAVTNGSRYYRVTGQ